MGTNDVGFSQHALLVSAVIGLFFSSLLFIFKHKAYTRWARASGRVVKLTPSKDIDGDTSGTWEACIEFETGDGKRVEFKDSVKSNPPVAHLGDAVLVLYKPTEPNTAVVDKFFNRHFFEFIVFVFGVVGLSIYLLRLK